MQEILVDVAKQVTDLVKLEVGGTNELRCTCEIVGNCDCQDFKHYHDLDFSLHLIVFVHFLSNMITSMQLTSNFAI